MARESVLIVEDEEDICELMRYNLDREGYRVITTGSGEEGLDAAKRESPDVVLLDLMLPGVDGLEVCRRLKGESHTSGIPIVMVSARGEEADVVTGLELGADDYVTKPFSPRVLAARLNPRGHASPLRSGGRRPRRPRSTVHGLLKIHPGRHEVVTGRHASSLPSPRTEFRILHLLARRPGWVFTRQQIIDAAFAARGRTR